MKKANSIFTLSMCALLGVLHMADLLLFTDITTGFVTVGNIAIRYAALGAGVLVCLVPMLYKKDKIGEVCFAKAHFVALGACGAISEMYGFFTIICFAFGKLGLLSLCIGILFILFGVFVFITALRKNGTCTRPQMYLGLLGTLALYLLVLMRFITRTSSLYRLAPTLGILSAMAALLFATYFIKVLALEPAARPYKGLAVFGQLCFLLCTCIELPHSLYLFCVGAAPLPDLLLALCVGTLGIVGALCSLSVGEA